MSQGSHSLLRPVVALMTDFGLEDGDVGVMKGVILGITPEAQLIDITHDVAPQNIASGAWIVSSGYRYFPKNTVFVCVVDPGVGSTRRAIAVHAGEWFFVGPDNGLFHYILAEQTVHAVHDLSNPAFHLPQVSSTFHGRDIFAPVGAHLAAGTMIAKLGSRVEPETLQRLDIRKLVRVNGSIDGHIVHVDRFGNLITNIPIAMVPELFGEAPIRITFPTLHAEVATRRRFFAAGSGDEQPFIYGDSSGYVGIAVRNGNAAKTLNASLGVPMTFIGAAKKKE